jgi:iron complex transport system substrate-binding protein
MGKYSDPIPNSMIRHIARWLFLLGLSALGWAAVSHAAMSTFIDEAGREVTLSFPPKRIISLAPNVTEILFALGADDHIVGVSSQSDYPEEAKNKISIGSYLSPDLERIVSLKPDLIIATGVGNTRDMVDRLGTLGLPVYVIFPKHFDGILESIGHLGQLVDRPARAHAVIQNMRRRRDDVKVRTRGSPPPRVLLLVGEAPMVAVGKGSFGDDLICLAGGENITGHEREMYPRLSMEEILKRGPEVILVTSMNPNVDYRKLLQEWGRWKMLPAVRHQRLHLINSDLVDRPSPRIIDGLETMARLFHPERFESKKTGSR